MVEPGRGRPGAHAARQRGSGGRRVVPSARCGAYGGGELRATLRRITGRGGRPHWLPLHMCFPGIRREAPLFGAVLVAAFVVWAALVGNVVAPSGAPGWGLPQRPPAR